MGDDLDLERIREYAGTAEGIRVTGVSLPPRPSSATRGRGVSGVSSFEEATFEAKLHELKFLPSGDCRIVLLIPESHGETAAELRQAYPLGLTVRIAKMSHDK